MKRTCVKYTDRIGVADYHMELIRLPRGNDNYRVAMTCYYVAMTCSHMGMTVGHMASSCS